MPSVTTSYMSAHPSGRLVVSGQQGDDHGIRDVWAGNLEEEFRKIRRIVQEYPFVAMDTEFPGVVARPNVGLSFYNEKGQTPQPISTWQFNFKFSLEKDMYAQDSVDLLMNAGITFSRTEKEGIDSFDFAALLISSGLLFNNDVHWIAFHSGYDFAYLLRALINRNLRIESDNFYTELKKYFPNFWDLKYIARSIRQLKGGLQDIADNLHVLRRGPQHQAGSDSLLTGDVFFRITNEFYDGNNPPAAQRNIVFGLDDDLRTGSVDDSSEVLNPDDNPKSKSIKGNVSHW